MRKFRSPDAGFDIPSRRRGSASPQIPQLFQTVQSYDEIGLDRDQNIIIHVRDENRKVSKDFVCSQQKLLKHMKYFECYLTEGYDDLDISVHCDIEIFEWLMEYMAHPEKVKSLSVNSVISILVSSDFLQMGDLVQQCLNYVKDTINQVLRLPIDLSCLSPDVIKRLSNLLTDDEIESIRDKKDKLQSKLFYHKVQQLTLDHPTLKSCAHCKKIYSQSHIKAYGPCPKAKISVNFHGLIVANHAPQENWDPWTHAQYVHKTDGMNWTWRIIYWRLWGHINILYCESCKKDFPAVFMNRCYYHPSSYINCDKGGIYPCCKQDYLQFNASTPQVKAGCSVRKHLVTASSNVLTKFNKAEDVIAPPVDQVFAWPSPEDNDGKGSHKSDSEESIVPSVIQIRAPPDRSIPEHRKKHRREKQQAQPSLHDGRDRDGRKPVTFFEIVIPCAMRRDMLREDDRRRLIDIFKLRDIQRLTRKTETRGSSKASEGSIGTAAGSAVRHIKNVNAERPLSQQRNKRKSVS